MGRRAAGCEPGPGKRPGLAGGNPETISASSRRHVHRAGQREGRRRGHAARSGGFSGKAVSTRAVHDRARAAAAAQPDEPPHRAPGNS